MPTAHLISGLPCSGKTTYAAALAADSGSVRFSLDYWLITTFGAYSIDEVGHDEHVRRVLSCREVIWSVAREFLRRRVDVILDDGFFLRANRRQYTLMAERIGARTKIHYLKTTTDVLRERLVLRNRTLPKYNFRIDAETLEAFLELFETPSADEAHALVVVDGGDSTRLDVLC